jgi:ribokinase
MGSVVVVGSYNQDHVWSCDELPVPGATRLGAYASGPGGKGFNQAVAARRAGVDTLFITALGRDDAASTARGLAAAEGIELVASTDDTLPSGTAGIFVDERGRNVIVVAPGANQSLSVDFIAANAPAFATARVVLAQLEVAPDAVLAALQAGREAGALTILNPAPANAPTTAALLACSDVLTPNETELAALLSRHADTELDADTVIGLEDILLHHHCRKLAPQGSVVITLGATGVFVSHAPDQWRGDVQDYYRLAAEPAEVLDTTGAGDAFSGALAAALALAGPDRPFVEALQFANRFAALSTEGRGAAVAMPHRAAVSARFAD